MLYLFSDFVLITKLMEYGIYGTLVSFLYRIK